MNEIKDLQFNRRWQKKHFSFDTPYMVVTEVKILIDATAGDAFKNGM